MTLGTVLLLCLATLGTSFLSGVFGMAGGMILIGILLALLPLPAAMALHAVVQTASNGSRAFLWRRHIAWRAAAFYAAGGLAALGVWSLLRFVPSPAVAMFFLGLSPFSVRLLPKRWTPDAENPGHGALCGAACVSLMLLTGVAGPLLDAFFLSGRMERRRIVATKAACQVFGHLAKLLYFGGLVADVGALDPLAAVLCVAASTLGTVLARPALEALGEAAYRRWAGRIVTAIAGWYLLYGAWLLAGGMAAG